MEADLPIYGLACPHTRGMSNEFDTETNHENCECTMKLAPEILLKGKITDSKTKAPFEAGLVNIYNATKSRGTTPDSNGLFELAASQNDEIRISFVGYKTISVKASELPKLIELQEKVEQLDEIIITGKKTSKKYVYAGIGFATLLLMYGIAEDEKQKKKK